MKKEKMINSKLRLNKQTLSILNEEASHNIVGGETKTTEFDEDRARKSKRAKCMRHCRSSFCAVKDREDGTGTR